MASELPPTHGQRLEDSIPAEPRAHRRARIVIAALGGALLVAVLPVVAFLVIDSIDYRYWPSGAEFEEGPAAHEVTVNAGGTFLLWKYRPFDTPDCRVTEVSSGEEIPLRDVTSEGWRRGGGATDYLAFAEGQSDVTRISVSCARTASSPHDGVEPISYYVDESDGPPFLDGLGPWWPTVPALILVGSILVAVAIAMRPRRPRLAG